MSTSDNIKAHHLIRKAIIYIRQSTPNQVISHQESLRLQYALKQRAVTLGWQQENIEVIDSDLGLSGASTYQRKGFQEILSKVALGEIGIILSYEVTRLSRNCSDWYPLLDICGYKGCLIADNDGIYDPGTSNGRLLLGLKGQISEMELHTLKSRLTAGLVNKAKRGELALSLPVGLIRDEQGVVYKDPNQEVRDRLDLVFTTFLRLGSASKTLRYFNEQELKIPRRDKYKVLVWKKPAVSAILSTLHNPAYAGAFVYGRSQATQQKSDPRKKVQKKLPIDQWKIIVKDKYPPYISWETFEKIQAKLKDNYAEYDRNKSRGIPRPGSALLHGITHCGECGHKMVVQYKGVTRYICNYLRLQYLVPVCQYIPADAVDAKVVQSFFEAFSTIEIDAYTHAIEKIKTIDTQTQQAQQQQIQRLSYQTSLAQRRYNQVDPDNRLVAAQLEAQWEHTLKELQLAQKTYEQDPSTHLPLNLPQQMIDSFLAIGQKLPEIWNHPSISSPTKKALIRCLIDKVVIRRIQRDQVEVRIVWKGGATSTTNIPITVGAFAELSNAKEMEEQIVELAKKGISDQQIARRLTQQGCRSPRNKTVLTSTVRIIRLKHRILINPCQSHPRKVPGFLTVSQLAKKLEVRNYWVYDRINNQTIQIAKNPETNGYLFPDTQQTIEKLLKIKNGIVENIQF